MANLFKFLNDFKVESTLCAVVGVVTNNVLSSTKQQNVGDNTNIGEFQKV